MTTVYQHRIVYVPERATRHHVAKAAAAALVTVGVFAGWGLLLAWRG